MHLLGILLLIIGSWAADVTYTFENACVNSGEIRDFDHDCVINSPATVSDGTATVTGSGHISVGAASTLIGSRSQFSIQLFGVSTSSFSNPVGAEYFIVMSAASNNFLNLRRERRGYLGISLAIGSHFYRSLSDSIFFDNSGERTITVTVDLASRIVVYVNGNAEIDMSVQTSSTFSSPVTEITFNGYYDNPLFTLSASFDEIQISRRVLSAAEVATSHAMYEGRTQGPSPAPQGAPSRQPTSSPTAIPTSTHAPSAAPSAAPSVLPTRAPSFRPSAAPAAAQIRPKAPSAMPSTIAATAGKSARPPVCSLTLTLSAACSRVARLQTRQ
jgi:hypothetical protein